MILPFTIFSVKADDSPSYDQTVEYIIGKAVSELRFKGIFADAPPLTVLEQSTSFPNRCEIEIARERIAYSTSSDQHSKGIIIDKETTTIHLNTIIPSTISISRSTGVNFETTLNFKTKVIKYFDQPGITNINGLTIKKYAENTKNYVPKMVCADNSCVQEKTEPETAFRINTLSKRNATGLKKALSHIVKICGGKEGLF